MTEFTRSPDPEGAPIDKLFTENNLEQLRWKLQGVLSDQPSKEEVIKAILTEHENMTHYMDRHNRVLEGWANTHRHTTLITGGGEGGEAAFPGGYPPLFVGGWYAASDGAKMMILVVEDGVVVDRGVTKDWNIEWFGWSPSGDRVVASHRVSTAGESRYTVVDVATGTVETGWPVITGNVEPVAFSPGGTLLALGWFTSTDWPAGFALVDVETKELVTGIYEPAQDVVALAWSPGQDRLAMQLEDNTIEVLDVAAGTATGGWPTLPGRSEGMSWTPDSSRLIVGHATSPYYTVINADTKTVETDWPTIGGECKGPAVSPDGTMLALPQVVSSDGIRVVDIATKTILSGWPAVPSALGSAWDGDTSRLMLAVGSSGIRVIRLDTLDLEGGWGPTSGSIIRVRFAWDAGQVASG